MGILRLGHLVEALDLSPRDSITPIRVRPEATYIKISNPHNWDMTPPMRGPMLADK